MTLHVLCTEQPPPYYRVRKDDCMPHTIGYTWLDQNRRGLSPSKAMIRNTCLGNDKPMMPNDWGGSPRPDEVDICLVKSSKFQEISPIETTLLLPLLEEKTAALN